MTTRIGNMLFLGNFAEMDTDDSTIPTEQPSILEGQTVTPQVIEMTQIDGADDGIIHIDNFTTRDDFQYDLGSGPVDTDLDSYSRYNVDVLMGDGTVANQDLAIIQLTNGDVFAFNSGGVFTNANVQSITINTHIQDFAGYGTSGDPYASNTTVVCFTCDAKILTPKGEVFARDLAVGDMVETLSGPRQIRWISTDSHDEPGRLAPIIFEPGALGTDLPSQALRLSPQHRVLIEGDLCNAATGHRAVLVSAKSLLPAPGVRQDSPTTAVSYVHLALDSHEIVFANGAPVESFWPGKQALRSLSPESLRRLVTNAPRLFAGFENNQTAAPIIEGQSRKELIARMIQSDSLRCGQFVTKMALAESDAAEA